MLQLAEAQTTECKLRAVIANYEFLLLTQSVSALFISFTGVFHFNEIFFNIILFSRAVAEKKEALKML
jgi:hypothetical protein